MTCILNALFSYLLVYVYISKWWLSSLAEQNARIHWRAWKDGPTDSRARQEEQPVGWEGQMHHHVIRRVIRHWKRCVIRHVSFLSLYLSLSLSLQCTPYFLIFCQKKFCCFAIEPHAPVIDISRSLSTQLNLSISRVEIHLSEEGYDLKKIKNKTFQKIVVRSICRRCRFKSACWSMSSFSAKKSFPRAHV